MDGLKLHRKISWLGAFFSFIVFIIISSHKILEIYDFYPILHLSVEWTLIGLLILHCIISQK